MPTGSGGTSQPSAIHTTIRARFATTAGTVRLTSSVGGSLTYQPYANHETPKLAKYQDHKIGQLYGYMSWPNA